MVGIGGLTPRGTQVLAGSVVAAVGSKRGVQFCTGRRAIHLALVPRLLCVRVAPVVRTAEAGCRGGVVAVSVAPREERLLIDEGRVGELRGLAEVDVALGPQASAGQAHVHQHVLRPAVVVYLLERPRLRQQRAVVAILRHESGGAVGVLVDVVAWLGDVHHHVHAVVHQLVALLDEGHVALRAAVAESVILLKS